MIDFKDLEHQRISLEKLVATDAPEGKIGPELGMSGYFILSFGGTNHMYDIMLFALPPHFAGQSRSIGYVNYHPIVCEKYGDKVFVLGAVPKHSFGSIDPDTVSALVEKVFDDMGIRTQRTRIVEGHRESQLIEAYLAGHLPINVVYAENGQVPFVRVGRFGGIGKYNAHDEWKEARTPKQRARFAKGVHDILQLRRPTLMRAPFFFYHAKTHEIAEKAMIYFGMLADEKLLEKRLRGFLEKRLLGLLEGADEQLSGEIIDRRIQNYERYLEVIRSYMADVKRQFK